MLKSILKKKISQQHRLQRHWKCIPYSRFNCQIIRADIIFRANSNKHVVFQHWQSSQYHIIRTASLLPEIRENTLDDRSEKSEWRRSPSVIQAEIVSDSAHRMSDRRYIVLITSQLTSSTQSNDRLLMKNNWITHTLRQTDATCLSENKET